jgi:hypothetical protein
MHLSKLFYNIKMFAKFLYCTNYSVLCKIGDNLEDPTFRQYLNCLLLFIRNSNIVKAMIVFVFVST